MAMCHNLVIPNLPMNQPLNAVNLKKVLSQSKFIYLLPSRALSLKDVSSAVEPVGHKVHRLLLMCGKQDVFISLVFKGHEK